jgi:Ni2+-binding GTPase involved in maturation of urease and hydrogenase
MPFIEMAYHHEMLAGMIQDHWAQRDMCVVGSKGSGKTKLIHAFADWLGYHTTHIELIPL